MGMTPNEPLEARLTAGLDDLAGPPTPGFRNDILAATARTRQRPAWSFIERWLPMAVITRPRAAAAPVPLARLLLLAALILVLGASLAFVGLQLLRGTVAIPEGRDAVFTFRSVAADAQKPQDVMTIRADGTDVRQLTTPDGTQWRFPQFSPDGTRI